MNLISLLADQGIKLKQDRQTEVNRRKLALNDEQDKLNNKSSKSKTEMSSNSKSEFAVPPFDAVEKLKLLVKKNSPRNDPNNLINNWLNNSKHVENFDNEPIFEEYGDEAMDIKSSSQPKFYDDSMILERKTNYFDPSLAKTPAKKIPISNKFQVAPKKVDTRELVIRSPNSKTKLNPVSLNKTSKSLKSSDEIVLSKLNSRNKNPSNGRVPVKSFELSEKDKKLLALDLEDKNVDDIMIVDSVKSN